MCSFGLSLIFENCRPLYLPVFLLLHPISLLLLRFLSPLCNYLKLFHSSWIHSSWCCFAFVVVVAFSLWVNFFWSVFKSLVLFLAVSSLFMSSLKEDFICVTVFFFYFFGLVLVLTFPFDYFLRFQTLLKSPIWSCMLSTFSIKLFNTLFIVILN